MSGTSWKDYMHNFITAVRGKPILGPGPPRNSDTNTCEGSCDTAEKRFNHAQERSSKVIEDLEIQLARENFFRGMNFYSKEKSSDEDA